MTLTSVGLALKLPPASHAVLIGKGAKPLRYFPTGPIKKDYVVVPRPMASDVDALAPWIAESVLFSQTVPKARPARAARRRSPTYRPPPAPQPNISVCHPFAIPP